MVSARKKKEQKSWLHTKLLDTNIEWCGHIQKCWLCSYPSSFILLSHSCRDKRTIKKALWHLIQLCSQSMAVHYLLYFVTHRLQTWLAPVILPCCSCCPLCGRDREQVQGQKILHHLAFKSSKGLFIHQVFIYFPRCKIWATFHALFTF